MFFCGFVVATFFLFSCLCQGFFFSQRCALLFHHPAPPFLWLYWTPIIVMAVLGVYPLKIKDRVQLCLEWGLTAKTKVFVTCINQVKTAIIQWHLARCCLLVSMDSLPKWPVSSQTCLQLSSKFTLANTSWSLTLLEMHKNSRCRVQSSTILYIF